jgi:hypothetical protein
MANFFERFETSSQAERAEMARNLKALYNQFYTAEIESFWAMRSAKHPGPYGDAAAAHRKAMTQLGTIQAVFYELGIEFDGLYDLEVSQ